jgi:hypothetical protein
MIGTDEHRRKAQSRLRELRKFLDDKKPGDYPAEEAEWVRLYEDVTDFFRDEAGV